MNWKEFLFDWRKFVLFIIFITTSYFVVAGGTETSEYRGFPFKYLVDGCVSEIICYRNHIYWNNLILDIITWCIISCLIIWIYDKVKKK